MCDRTAAVGEDDDEDDGLENRTKLIVRSTSLGSAAALPLRSSFATIAVRVGVSECDFIDFPHNFSSFSCSDLSVWKLSSLEDEEEEVVTTHWG